MFSYAWSRRRIVPLIAALVSLTVAADSSPRPHAQVQAGEEAAAIRAKIAHRLQQDTAQVTAALTTAAITDDQRAALLSRLAEAAKEIPSLPDPDVTRFTTVFPLNPLHERILAVHGAALRAAGVPPLIVWKTHRYDAVPLLAVPPSDPPPPTIDVTMMRDEYRADTLLLTNATDQRVEAHLQITGVPGAPAPAWLRLSSVEWTDTREGVAVADALRDLTPMNGTFAVGIPGGMTRKLWLTVDSAALQPKSYDGIVSITAGSSHIRVPLKLSVSSVTMARPRLSLGMWDYSNAERGPYGVKPANRDAAIALMRSHFVDSPWATGEVLPWPKGSDFAAAGTLSQPLDFGPLDDWIRRWPDARRYYVFANVKNAFAGASMNTPEFAARLGAWARALGQHASALGLKPHQLALLLVDEPRNQEQDAIITAWTKVLKSNASEIGIFEDPLWLDPVQAAPESLALVDEICFHLGLYSRGGINAERYYDTRRAEGQHLWLYQTSGPSRSLDPTTYYRLAGWYAFRLNTVGIGFWAFGDTGGTETSWNEYASSMTRVGFAPAFLGRQDATDSVHWQAVREGIEDYEYLAMLRDAAAAARDGGMKRDALALLGEASSEVPGAYTGKFDWDANARHRQPDEYRLRIMARLGSMRGRP
jgi:hypothetical protein